MVCAEGNAGDCNRKVDDDDDDDCEGGEDDDVTRKALLFELWLRGQRCALLLHLCAFVPVVFTLTLFVYYLYELYAFGKIYCD